MRIAGVDEAGRGPLAGPVIAAAVILDNPIEGVTDSKKLTAKRREALAETIKKEALSFAVGCADVEEIDRLNIHHATLLAMQRAIVQLTPAPDSVLVDGSFCPDIAIPCRSIVKGDLKEVCIGAASILAKVYRDKIMRELDELYPDYGFAVHKGYATAVHKAALEKWGPCSIHRKSFQPVITAATLNIAVEG